jgi:hypothetical protein
MKPIYRSQLVESKLEKKFNLKIANIDVLKIPQKASRWFHLCESASIAFTKT